MSLLLKKCTAMYTTMSLYLIARNELKRGKRHQGLLIYQWNHIQIYSYNASIITLNRWQEGRGSKRQTQYRKDHPFEFETPFAVVPMLCYSLRKRQMETSVCACVSLCLQV